MRRKMFVLFVMFVAAMEVAPFYVQQRSAPHDQVIAHLAP